MKLPTHISYILKKSYYLLSWKSLSCLKFPNLKYFQIKFKSFQNPFHLFKMEEVMLSSLQGFVTKRIWIQEDHKCKMKVWESPFIPSHLTFKSFEFTHFLSINQIYLFIITFQKLEFWDVTNLPPLKWISSSRFGEASKKRLGFGVSSKSIDRHRGLGCYHP